MNSQKGNKLNRLLQALPAGCIAISLWLRKKGIYRQLADVYCKSGWLRKIGHGAYARESDDVSWTGGLYAIQQQMDLPIHVGAKTALQRKGLAHFLPIGGGTIFLLGTPSVRLPKWFTKYDWGVNIHYSTSQLFGSGTELGLTKEDIGQYAITISSPERAIMEVLHFVPKEESFESARHLMEGLTTLRPTLVQELLEKCQSVKVVRLFLFLAEECGHDWINDLVTSRMDLGKGKRVIVKDGRLDPIYKITVANALFTHPTRQMQNLLNKQKKSPAVRLMCPEEGTKLTYGKEHGCFGSILYLASECGELPILDQLLKDFQIEKRGSPSFRNRLKENWLQDVPKNNLREIKKGSNNVFASLIELVVAQHLKEDGATIVNLEAWQQQNTRGKVADIEYQDNGQLVNAEIKYVDQSPEWQKNIVNQLKTGNPEVRWFGDGEFVNYFFGRIAEATKQLQPFDYKTRQIWLVFSALANFERKIFEENYLKHPPPWFKNTEKQKNILKMFGKEIADKAPSEWLKEVPEIGLATFDSWTLKNIEKYQTKGLLT